MLILKNLPMFRIGYWQKVALEPEHWNNAPNGGNAEFV